MKKTFLFSAVLAVFMLAATVSSSQAQAPEVLFDSIGPGAGGGGRGLLLNGNSTTDDTQGGPGGTFGASYFANAINFGGATNTPTNVTSLDFYLFYSKAVTYTTLSVNTQFWNEFGGAVDPTKYFADAAQGVQTFNIAASSLGTPVFDNATLSIYTVTLDFNSPGHTPVFLKDRGSIGIAMNILGDGVITNNLTGVRTRSIDGSPFAIGSSAIGPPDVGGYLRNQNKSVDFNFTKSPNELIGADSSIPANRNIYEAFGMRVSGVAVVPEAGTIALFALGAGVPLAGIVLRRRKK